MQKIRQTNNHSINMSVLQKLVVIAVALFRSVFFFEGKPARVVKICASIKIGHATRAERLRVHLTRPTGADNSKLQFFAHSRSGGFQTAETMATKWNDEIPIREGNSSCGGSRVGRIA
jgi:hypothetical protein